MIEKINSLLHEVESFAPTTAAQVEEFRIKILGKKGELNALMEEFKQVPAEQKREMGQKINALKQAAQERINSLKASLGSGTGVKVAAVDDMTRPGSAAADGTRHPI
ncbi:MAG: phenylalanine--tRNA ligase subunit alpha, partial [Alistipes sp.]|nr:phenylalanine--tRNA ligase subunit alpha [Alistipes sp.]